MEFTTQHLYRHYKKKLYKFIGLVKHSETLEDLVLYRTLYKNSESDVWVRPKDMFFGKTEVDGIKVPRFEPVLLNYQIYNELDDNLKKNLNSLAKSIFANFNDSSMTSKIDVKSSDEFTDKLKDKNNVLILVASESSPENDAKIIGFKIGYERSNEVFYSWLGAVHPEYRGLGVGYELLRKQHKWCETMGFKFIEAKTTNQWKKMLLLNLKSGFDIFGTEFNSKKELEILLRKKLN